MLLISAAVSHLYSKNLKTITKRLTEVFNKPLKSTKGMSLRSKAKFMNHNLSTPFAQESHLQEVD